MENKQTNINMTAETRNQLNDIGQRLRRLGYEVNNPKHPDSISISAVIRVLASMEYYARNITSEPSIRIK